MNLCYVATSLQQSYTWCGKRLSWHKLQQSAPIVFLRKCAIFQSLVICSISPIWCSLPLNFFIYPLEILYLVTAFVAWVQMLLLFCRIQDLGAVSNCSSVYCMLGGLIIFGNLGDKHWNSHVICLDFYMFTVQLTGKSTHNSKFTQWFSEEIKPFNSFVRLQTSSSSWVQVLAAACHLTILSKGVSDDNKSKHLGVVGTELRGSSTALAAQTGKHKHRAFPSWPQLLRAETGSPEKVVQPLLQYWLRWLSDQELHCNLKFLAVTTIGFFSCEFFFMDFARAHLYDIQLDTLEVQVWTPSRDHVMTQQMSQQNLLSLILSMNLHISKNLKLQNQWRAGGLPRVVCPFLSAQFWLSSDGSSVVWWWYYDLRLEMRDTWFESCLGQAAVMWPPDRYPLNTYSQRC